MHAATVAMWIKVDADMERASAIIFESGDSWAGLNLVLDRGNLVAAAWNRLEDGVAGGFTSTVSAGAIETGTWVHLALVHRASTAGDAGVLNVYLNGELVASGTAGVVPVRTAALAIGAIDGETRFRNRGIRRLQPLSAQVDQMGIWDVALDQSQLQEIFSKTFR
jgi:hypothetical protein